MKPSIRRAPFGTMPDGTPVELFTLNNANGARVAITNYGAAIVSLQTLDRDGVLGNIVLGMDSLAGYLEQPSYLGAVVGRYANRIAKGKFSLDGRIVQLPLNDGTNHLHGGSRGFDKMVWRAEPFTDDRGVGLRLGLTSPDGDEGYPGTLEVEVRYQLTEDDELEVEYEAATDAATPVNLTQHSYFNLAGSDGGDILGHQLMIRADRFIPVDSGLIPTGAMAPVANTPLDFRTPTAIGARIHDADPQLGFAGGYDHSFVLRRGAPGLVHAARLTDAGTGRTLDVSTTEPGLHFYSGNFLDGRPFVHRTGLSLETQHYPDSPNHPEFPSTILKPNERYRSRTVFAFGVLPGGSGLFR
jgi:aldose 1-epimerase